MKYKDLISVSLLLLMSENTLALNWYALTEYTLRDMESSPAAQSSDAPDLEWLRGFVSASTHHALTPSGSLGFSAYAEYERHLTSSEEETRSSLTELYFSQNLKDNIFLDIGKKKQIIGTAFFRSPSDFFYPNINAIDLRLGSTFDEKREGLIGVGLTYLAETFEVGNYYSPRVSALDFPSWDEHMGLTQPFDQNQFKITWRLANVDVAFLHHLSKAESDDSVQKFGANFVFLLTNAIEIHGDAVLVEREGRLITSHEKIVQEDKTWFYQSTLGLSWTISNNLNLIFEYYHNQYGLQGKAYDDFLAYDVSQSGFSVGEDPRLSYGVFNLGRHYLINQITYQTDLTDFQAELFHLSNLEDGSGMLTLELSKRLNGSFTVLSNIGFFYGGEQSEARLMRERGRVSLAVKMYF